MNILNQTVSRFHRHYPSLKLEQIEKYAQRYFDTWANELMPVFNKLSETDTINLSLRNMREKMGYFKINYERHHIFNVVTSFITYEKSGYHQPPFREVSVGSNLTGKQTTIRISSQFIDDIFDTASKAALLDQYWVDGQNYLSLAHKHKLHMVPIDMKGLDQALAHAHHQLNTALKASEYHRAIRDAIRTYKIVKNIAEQLRDDLGGYFLPQIPIQKPYGRTYYKNPNIQQFPKIVRRGVLGEHYVYDISNSVYAWKLSMAKLICSHLKEKDVWTWTADFVEQKNARRKALAAKIYAIHKELAHPVNMELAVTMAKKLITAVGFGARLTEGSWRDANGNRNSTAIVDIIKNKTVRKAVLNDDWFNKFAKEQQQLNMYIYNNVVQLLDDETIADIKSKPNMLNAKGEIKIAQFLAYMYQTAETRLMKSITYFIEQHTQQSALCVVHDAVLYKKKLDDETLTNLYRHIENIAYGDTVRLEMKREEGIPFNLNAIEEIRAHIDRMHQEEQRARQQYTDVPIYETEDVACNISLPSKNEDYYEHLTDEIDSLLEKEDNGQSVDWDEHYITHADYYDSIKKEEYYT